MIKIAFCDDDMEVLHQMNELLDRYRVERNEDITYAAFQSPFELLTENYFSDLIPGVCGGILFGWSLFLPVETDLGGKLFPADGCGAGTKTFISSGKRSSSGKRRESG